MNTGRPWRPVFVFTIRSSVRQYAVIVLQIRNF